MQAPDDIRPYLDRLNRAQLRAATIFIWILLKTHKSVPRPLWPVLDLAGSLWAWLEGER